ncbi:hypothetical protein SAG0169_03035 [Streptococcus agalactiae LDS 610]|nr:hypothetical protein SAG0169_03035 [Streptococcus agalactiae LDS 610]
MGINLFLVKSRSSTIQDLFLFVFTQDILHYLQKGKKEQLKINYGIIFGLVMLSPVFLVGSIENIFGLIGGVLFTATFPALIVDSLYAAYYIHKHPEYE